MWHDAALESLLQFAPSMDAPELFDVFEASLCRDLSPHEYAEGIPGGLHIS